MIRELASEAAPGGSSHRAGAILLMVSCALALGIGPLLHGSPIRAVASYELYLASYILAPGVLFYRLVAGPDDDAITYLAMGWICGIVFSIVVLLVLKVSGTTAAYPFVPLVLLPLLASLWRRGRGPASTSARVRAWHCAILSALLIVAGLRAHMVPASNVWQGFEMDLYFHASNAAELLHHWPMSDPRLAGATLNYPFFAYVPAVGAGLATKIAMSEIMRRLACGSSPVLLGLMLFEAGRASSSRTNVGLIAAALVLCHGDIADEVGHWFGRRWNVSSFLAFGVYDSPTTSYGLAFFAALAILVRRCLVTSPAGDRRPLFMTALVAVAASGTKGSVMPVAIGGSLIYCVLQILAERRLPRRALVVLGVLTVASLPVTLLLVEGGSSFASAMFRFVPGAALCASGLSYNLARGLGYDGLDPPLWFTLTLFPFWLALYLGPTALGVALFVRSRRVRWGAFESWLLANGIAGMALGVGLAAPGYSQLFFAYTGQVALAVIAAVGFDRFRPRLASGSGLVAALIVALGLISLVPGIRQLELNLERGAPAGPLESRYLEGLAWLRAHAPEDAVLLTLHPILQLSVNAERRVFFESARFRPETHRLGWKQRKGRWIVVWPEPPPDPRIELVQRFVDDPTLDTFRPIRAAVPGARTWYLVLEDAAIETGPGHTEQLVLHPLAEKDPRSRSPILRLEFENPAVRIYRVVDS